MSFVIKKYDAIPFFFITLKRNFFYGLHCVRQ